jgi:hypothetical protein
MSSNNQIPDVEMFPLFVTAPFKQETAKCAFNHVPGKYPILFLSIFLQKTENKYSGN